MAAPPTATEDAQTRAQAFVGQTLDGRYRIDDILAMGAMGTVYLARHLKLKKRVALKVLHPDVEDHPDLVLRFEREAQAGARVAHPNVAAATDFGELEDGSKYLVMEYVKGSTLRAVLDAQAPLSQVRSARIARQVALALDAIHARGILHRDLKPRNIMLGDDDFVKVVDFGLSRLERARDSAFEDPDESSNDGEARITGTGMVFGTVDYMAPEAAFGMDFIDARADLFALGVMLYEMLAGKHPYDGETNLEIWTKVRGEPIPRFHVRAPQVDVSPALEAVVRRLLDKDPDERFQTASELVDALDHAEPDGRIAPTEPRELMRSVPPSSSHPRSVAPRSVAPSAAAAPAPSLPAPAPKPILSSVPKPTPPVPGRHRGLLVFGGGVAFAALLYALGVGDPGPAGTPPAAGSASAPAREVTTSGPVPGEVRAPAGPGPGEVPAAGPEGSAAPAGSTGQAPDAPGSGAPGSDAPAPDAAAPAATPAQLAALRLELLRASGDGHWVAASDAALALLAADPTTLSRRDEQRTVAALLQALERARHPRTAEVWRAVALAPGGPDLLYRFAESGGKSAWAGRARVLLRDAAVQASATPAVRVAFALREAPCDEKLEILDRAVAEGDERALVALQIAKACFKKSHSVDQAASRLREKLDARTP